MLLSVFTLYVWNVYTAIFYLCIWISGWFMVNFSTNFIHHTFNNYQFPSNYMTQLILWKWKSWMVWPQTMLSAASKRSKRTPYRFSLWPNFEQLVVNCLKTLRRDKRELANHQTLHNESIPHHWNFDKGEELEFSGQILTRGGGIKILPTAFLSRAKSPKSWTCRVQLLLMVARRRHNTDLSHQPTKSEKYSWKCGKYWKSMLKGGF